MREIVSRLDPLPTSQAAVSGFRGRRIAFPEKLQSIGEIKPTEFRIESCRGAGPSQVDLARLRLSELLNPGAMPNLPTTARFGQCSERFVGCKQRVPASLGRIRGDAHEA